MAAKKKTFTSIRDEEHVISELPGRQSREQILLDALAERYNAGTVLGKITANGRYKIFDPGAGDGTELPAAVLAPTEDPLEPVGHVRTSAHVRGTEVNGHKIFWIEGITPEEKAAAEAVLAEAGVLVRY